MAEKRKCAIVPRLPCQKDDLVMVTGDVALGVALTLMPELATACSVPPRRQAVCVYACVCVCARARAPRRQARHRSRAARH